MSWLARSLANSLRLDEEEDDDEGDNLENDAASNDNGPRSSMPRHESQNNVHLSPSSSSSSSSSSSEEDPHARGVKEDLTELGQTLSRRFWGVANFLAPPPDARTDARLGSSVDRSESDLNRSRPSDRSESGIGPGLREVRDRVKNGDTEAPEMALDYHPFESEENERENLVSTVEVEEGFEEKDEEIDVVGITDEVLAFARNIARHPETWLDFPLDPEEDLDDFNMSDSQRAHALAIEHLSPRLAALRIELCPGHMSLGYFWKVYFVLLHSRLSKHDAEILSTPQVMEARALWMKELQKQTNPESDWFGRSISSLKAGDTAEEDITPSSSNYCAPPEFLSPRIYAFEPPSILTHDHETVKQTSENTETQFVDKAVIEEVPVHKSGTTDMGINHLPRAQPLSYEDDDDWPEDEDSVYGGCARPPIFAGDEEDVSFSDLEGDDDISSLALNSKKASNDTETRTA